MRPLESITLVKSGRQEQYCNLVSRIMSDERTKLIEPEAAEASWLVKNLRIAWEDASEAFAAFSYFEPNPCFYLITPILAILVFAGLCVHAPFRQGGPIRADESALEKEVRVRWILMTDGPFAMAAVYDTASIIAAVIQNQTDDVVLRLVGLGISMAYILGNVVFLKAMQNRDRPLVRVAITANVTFAFGLLNLFVWGVLWARYHNDFHRTSKIVDWILRAVVVCFFIVGASTFLQLWHAYDDDQPPATSFVHFLRHLSVTVAAIAVWCVFVFAIFLDGPKAIWAALA